MNVVVEDKLPELVDICRRHGIVRLELFGSAARDDFQPATSDLDLVATFDDASSEGGIKPYLNVLCELENLFGCQVDLLEANAITNPFLLEAIEQDRIVLCERRNGHVMARNPGTYLHDAAMALAAISRGRTLTTISAMTCCRPRWNADSKLPPRR
jgi:predicted nucleotidyltransferase